MMVTAFGVGLLLGRTLDHSALPLTLGVGGFGIAVAATAWTLVRRDGDPASMRTASAFGSVPAQ